MVSRTAVCALALLAAGCGETPAGPRVPPHISVTVRLSGALTGVSRPVGYSVPAAGCNAVGADVRPTLSSIAFLDLALDRGDHDVVTLTAEAGSGPRRATVGVHLLAPGSDPAERTGTGIVAIAADGSGTLDATTGSGPTAVTVRATWSCTG